MNYSRAEENYLKTIYHLSEKGDNVTTNAIAEVLSTKPASVSDMIKKLDSKRLVNYVKYKGVTLTDDGRKIALWVIRKHRLWEVFLLEKLKFNWDEVHEVAEQLEHIKSVPMIERLDEFLGYPKFDPHGDPIPDAKGNFNHQVISLKLSECKRGRQYKVVSVDDSNSTFLQYLDKVGIGIGTTLKILDAMAFDNSLEIEVDSRNRKIVSQQVSENILVCEFHSKD
ncbi:metal-dependent transcriptional regulator [Limibacter armeniacum]|uniref:metal-dependent transcriptional regulator n=1 Tax=Limibacter armeniacum TaxID=466084 RepID=UPI002FE5C7AC